MSRQPTYLNRLHDELMAAGYRLHRQRRGCEGKSASQTRTASELLGRIRRMSGDAMAHTRRRSGRRRARRRQAALAIGTAGGIAAAATLALTISGEPTGTQAAYAGWTASPTAPAHGQTAQAEASCRSHIGRIDALLRDARATPERGAQPVGSKPHEPQVLQTPTIAPGEWQKVLSDTRGPYTMLIFEADEGHAKETCLTNDGSLFYGSGSYEPRPATPPSGGISVFHDGVVGGDPEGGRPDPYTFIDGQAGTGVTGVTVDLADGRHVQATVMGGWFLAWWPGTEKALSAKVADTRGTRMQPLAK